MLKKHAAWMEENRRLHDEVIEAMADAGIFRLRIPARYGGFESDGRTLVEALSELAQGDGAAAWNASVWSIGNWQVGVFPDAVQDEVFATPDVRVCAVLSPTAIATPRPGGGLLLNGQWGFVSGALHSQWQVVIAMGPAPDGGQWPIIALVPMSDLRIVDDWHTAGLKGTGSVTTVAEDVLVPAERVLPMVAILQDQYASRLNADSPIFRTPMIPTGAMSFAGTGLGLAKAAQKRFFERLPGRKITYTEYAAQSEAPVTHLQIAKATLAVDEAEFHAHRLADLVDHKGVSGETWTMEERALARVALARVADLTKNAVDILNSASGGSSIYSSEPIQRIERDVQTFNLHALMHPHTNFEMYGRVLCNLEPNTLYI